VVLFINKFSFKFLLDDNKKRQTDFSAVIFSF